MPDHNVQLIEHLRPYLLQLPVEKIFLLQQKRRRPKPLVVAEKLRPDQVAGAIALRDRTEFAVEVVILAASEAMGEPGQGKDHLADPVRGMVSIPHQGAEATDAPAQMGILVLAIFQRAIAAHVCPSSGHRRIIATPFWHSLRWVLEPDNTPPTNLYT